MKKKITFIIVVLITIAIGIVYGHITKSFRIYDSNINNVSYQDIGVLTEGQTLSQRFICSRDVLDGLFVKTGVAGNYADAVVTLTLSDALSGEILLQTSDQGSNFRPRKIHLFKTDRREGMKERDLILTITETGSTSGNGISFYIAREEQASKLAQSDDTPLDGVLAIGTALTGFDTETFIIFLLSIWFIWAFMWILYKLFQ